MRRTIKQLIGVAAVWILIGCDASDVPNILQNNGNDVVKNVDTHLIWQNEKIGHGTREEAIAFCDDLTLNNITHWRLPTSAESQWFHATMNAKGEVPVQLFPHCVAEVTQDGYVRTRKGAETYGGKPGDPIAFRGAANIRCVAKGE